MSNSNGIYYRSANGLTSSISWIKLLDSNNSSVSGGGNAWGSSITININGTSKTLTIPSNPNTDYLIKNSIKSFIIKGIVEKDAAYLRNAWLLYKNRGVIIENRNISKKRSSFL